MLIRPALVLASLLLATSAVAEPLVYRLTDPAQKYAIELRFAQAPATSYDPAPATVSLRDKASGELLQTLVSPEGLCHPQDRRQPVHGPGADVRRPERAVLRRFQL